jgi:hypothetical protein
MAVHVMFISDLYAHAYIEGLIEGIAWGGYIEGLIEGIAWAIHVK